AWKKEMGGKNPPLRCCILFSKTISPPHFFGGDSRVSVSKRELNKWRREAESMRRRLGKLSAELDAIERLEPSPEAAESIAKRRAEIAELLDQLARIGEKKDSFEPFAPHWWFDDL